jgi:putative lipoprotein (rSAM/lipoprotein system)
MSKLIKRTFRLQSKFYLRILQIMGICGAGLFTACKYGSPEAEYGVPTNDIKFFGTIKSADSLIKIPGLTVRLVRDYSWGDSLQTTTNTQGEYTFYNYAMEGDQYKIKVFDNDSSANAGDFKTKIINIEVSGRDVNNSEHQTDVLMQKK